MTGFSALTEKLQAIFQKLRGKGKLSEADVNAALREVRLALLEADVNYTVVKDFIEKVRARAVGQEVLQSLTPAQQVVKIVYEELTALMGTEHAGLVQPSAGPAVIMLVGLHGSGKTTTAAKLAQYLRRQGKQPLLVAADVHRPAAVEQLQILGKQIEVPVLAQPGGTAVGVAREALATAARLGHEAVVVDTAGRLHIDAQLMEELRAMRAVLKPTEVLLVVDAMTGQDAVNVAKGFHEGLGIDGIVLTKLDGDTRGGAALSVRAVTGCPIKFVGVGEKLDALEPFHPSRMASRILGMGDVLSLIEKAQAKIDVAQAKEMQRKLRQRDFTLEDFLEQLRQVRQLGSLEEIIGMLPGAGTVKELKNLRVDEKELTRIEAIICSMTPQERRYPQIINASRKRRISQGSGTTVQDVNRLLKQFAQTQKILRQLAETTAARRPGGPFGLPFWR
ncbi:MAG: signal recognition particle protein [Clostridia bacterium]|nr:signal recognition particle protein [Clostridia bacterium]